MSNLLGKPPLGLKEEKPTEKKRKPMRKVSRKRQAYRQSKEGQDALEYMGKVKALPCVICGAPPPSEAHHCRSDGMARDDLKTIPLCIPCHTGPKGYHRAKKTWEANNGPDYGFIPIVRAQLTEMEIDF
jgi:hypothetical protein